MTHSTTTGAERQQHWDAAYERVPMQQLGWYEASPEVSLELLERTGARPDDLILDVGSGASTFVAELVARGYQRIAAIDISAVALDELREMLGEGASAVRLVQGDVTHLETFEGLQSTDVWHDRAALHFLTDPADQQSYADALRATVRPGGAVILAAFAIGGATHCSNLPIVNYDAAMFERLLGAEFTLEETREHLYINPGGGERPYVYARFSRREG